MTTPTTDPLAGIPEPDHSRILAAARGAWDKAAFAASDDSFTKRQIADEAYKGAIAAGVAAYWAAHSLRMAGPGEPVCPDAQPGIDDE